MLLNLLCVDVYRVIMLSIYPLLQAYAYFVIIGLYCLEENLFRGWHIYLIFMAYHTLAMSKVVYYLELLTTEDFSTIKLFPRAPDNETGINLHGFNRFLQQDIIKKSLSKPKNCHTCKTYKPPRSHHCNICGKCYLKFDHHCVFLDSCIGFHNYKFFFQFLVLNCISSMFYIIVLGLQLRKKLTPGVLTNYIISLSLVSFEFLLVFYFLILHSFLISNNETTVEFRALNAYLVGDYRFIDIFQEGPMTMYSTSRNRKELNPYNLSIKENWRQVFGDSILDWIYVKKTSKGDGVTFPKNYIEFDML